MNTRQAMFGVVVTAVVFAVAVTGCDKKPDPKAGAGRPSPAEYNNMMEQARTAARDAAAKAAAAATQRAAGTQASATDVKLLEQAAAADVKARGADLLGKLETAVRANKLDDAQTYVDAFDKIKESVPADLKTRYESLKAEYKAAKDKATTPKTAPAPATPAEPNK